MAIIRNKNIINAWQIKRGSSVVNTLRKTLIDNHLVNWLKIEAGKRIEKLPPQATRKEIQNLLEMGNRYPDGSMTPISLAELLKMENFCLSPGDIINRAKEGKELLQGSSNVLGTAVRGVPAGGASTRASKWVQENLETAKLFGIEENTPRFLYRVGGKTLLQWTLDFSQVIARKIGKTFPNIIMTNTEIINPLLEVVKNEWGNWNVEELKHTYFFNQIVLPRIWVEDQKITEGKLYPAGHGDFPYLLAKYNMAKTLASWGIRYLVFSNADEWLWQADPVMISIAEQLFNKGHHMLIIGVENTNNQFGGGFVKKADGGQSLVETPRLPWEIVKEGKAPIALNTTFYIIDVNFLAENQSELMNVEKSLIVKEVPGRAPGTTEQILGVDSWAGDVFAAITNPAFILWPRLNFLGIKDGSFITGSKPVDFLGGRTYLHYVNETVMTYPVLMDRLLDGDKSIAEYLFNNGYSYLPLSPLQNLKQK